MSDSSIESSEGPPVPSSDSLDTTIGFSTETGRATAVAFTSSSEENVPLSDPTLTSDSSRPVTPRPQGGGQGQDGGSYRVPRAGPSSVQREHAGAAAAAVRSPERAAPGAGEQPSLPAPAASRPGANSDIEGPATAQATAGNPGQPPNLLQVLWQMQWQQMQQQEQLTALMRQLAPEVSSRTEPGPQLAEPPPSPSPLQGRLPPQVGDPPRPGPRPPRAPDICDQCERQQVHICIYSYAPSDLSGGSECG